MKYIAPGSLADQPSKPQAPPGADAGAAGEPVLSHAAASAAGTNCFVFLIHVAQGLKKHSFVY